MPAGFHSYTHLHPLCRQITVTFLRSLAVLQSPLLQFPGIGIHKSNLLEARMIVTPYNNHVGSFLPGLGWFQHHQSLLGRGSRHCYGINYSLTNYEVKWRLFANNRIVSGLPTNRELLHSWTQALSRY